MRHFSKKFLVIFYPNLAFSLIEVLVAIGILSIAMGGLFTGLVLSSNEAMQDLYDHVAHNAAQGYLNQLIAMPKASFVAAINDPSGVLLPTSSLQKDSNGNISWQSDPLAINGLNSLPQDGQPFMSQPQASNNQKTVFLRYNPKEPQEIDTMDINFTVYLSDLEQSAIPVKAYSIVLVAYYSVPSFSGLMNKSITVGEIKNFN